MKTFFLLIVFIYRIEYIVYEEYKNFKYIEYYTIFFLHISRFCW